MKSRNHNYKINEIISLSQNYKLHRNNLETIKPAVNTNNHKRQNSISKLAEEKLRYRQAIRNYNDVCLKKENTRFIDRITKAGQQRDSKRKSLQRQKLKSLSRSKFSPYDSQRSLSRSSSKSLKPKQSSSRLLDLKDKNQTYSNKKLKSMASSRSLSSISSNYRQKLMREKQIQRQNNKLAARILNPKSKKTLALHQLNKSYQKEQQYVRVRSRYSQKNQQIIKSLALQGLKFQRKDVQYLPQLTNRKAAPKTDRPKIKWDSSLK